MRLVRFYTAIGVAAIIAVGVAILPQESNPAQEPDYRWVQVQAEKTRYKWGDSEVALLSGNVRINQGDTVLTADEVEYNQNEEIQTAVATGNVKIVDPENEVTGEKATAFFNEKRAVIEGNVKLVAKPRNRAEGGSQARSVRSEWDEKAVITCDVIEYLYQKKEATATGNLKIVQKDRTLTAEKVFYQVRPELITLSGGVKGRDSKNQTFSSPGVVRASLKEGDEWLEMENAVSTFRIRVEEDEEESQPVVETPEPVQVEDEAAGEVEPEEEPDTQE